MARRQFVIAVVTNDDRTAAAIGLAADRARRVAAPVILYDVEAAPSPLESPLPTQWSGEGDDQRIPPVLTTDQLHAVGQADLARKVQALADSGIDAYGWLPSGGGAEELATYAEAMGASVIITTRGVHPDPVDLRERATAAVMVAEEASDA